MADTRTHDLESLVKNRRSAKNAFERNLADRTIHTIIQESGAVKERREKLVMAVRNNDRRAVSRFTHELSVMRANETKGKDY